MFSAPHYRDLANVQDRPDTRGIALTRAGIKGLRLPITIVDEGRPNAVTAQIEIYSSLSPDKRGVHLSNLMSAAMALRGNPVNANYLKDIALKARNSSKYLSISLTFVYFLEKESPVSKVLHLLDYRCSLTVELRGDEFVLTKEVQVPVTTLCPDSKELSKYGAHSQRSLVTVQVKNSPISLTALIKIAESGGSCEIYQILNKLDDKFVTEKAYQTPRFVEDVVREVATKLKQDEAVSWFKVFSQDFESNHNYDAYAETQFQGEIQYS